MANKNKKAFTLVELLAVIVILAIIVVIAIPEIMNVITESRKGALASSAKLIASSAESAYISNQTLGIEKTIECSDVSNYTAEDYTSCSIKFVDGKAKVKIIGQGKFEGMAVCGGTKENAEVVEECPVPVSFTTDSWETIKAAVDEGDTGNYNVGDTKTVDLGELGTHTLRIANNSHYGAECKDTSGNALASETACGFVIEFVDIITTHNMNDIDSSVGGWPGSNLYSYVNGEIYNALVATIGNVIIDTKAVSSHGIRDTTGTLANNNFESTDKVYLLSTREVYGKEGTSNQITHDTADGDTITRQLDYYATYENADGTTGVTTSKYAGAIKQNSGSNAVWWLRSAVSDTVNGFYVVNGLGGGNSLGTPKQTLGVSPAFRLG